MRSTCVSIMRRQQYLFSPSLSIASLWKYLVSSPFNPELYPSCRHLLQRLLRICHPPRAF